MPTSPLPERLRGGSRRRATVVALALLGAVVLVVVLVVAYLVRSQSDVRGALDRAFAAPIGSANVSIGMEVQVNGLPEFREPARLRLKGPYIPGGDRGIPRADWNASLSRTGQTVAGKFISTGDNAYVVFLGVPYEVGRAKVAEVNRQIIQDEQRSRPQSLQRFGVDPRSWVTGAEDRGDATVAGSATTHYAAALDVGRFADDLGRVAQQAGGGLSGGVPPPRLSPEQRTQLTRVVRNPTFDVYVGQDDGRIHRLAVRAPFSVPPEGRARAGGATGGLVSFSIEYADIGKPQRIVAPPNARPLAELSAQVAGLGAGSGAPGGAPGGTAAPGAAPGGPTEPAPGGQGSAPSPLAPGGAAPGGAPGATPSPPAASSGDAQVKRYSQCVAQAGGRRAALDRCARLIR